MRFLMVEFPLLFNVLRLDAILNGVRKVTQNLDRLKRGNKKTSACEAARGGL